MSETNGVCNNRQVSHSADTPPTPDLDAVVARVRDFCNVLTDCNASDVMFDIDGQNVMPLTVADLRALLAAVSRPAEARGEPSEEMVEAGARALHDGLESGVSWDGLFPSMQDVNRKASRDVLRAALAAQREQKP